jgi:hypothetical protein
MAASWPKLSVDYELKQLEKDDKTAERIEKLILIYSHKCGTNCGGMVQNCYHRLQKLQKIFRKEKIRCTEKGCKRYLFPTISGEVNCLLFKEQESGRYSLEKVHRKGGNSMKFLQALEKVARDEKILK